MKIIFSYISTRGLSLNLNFLFTLKKNKEMFVIFTWKNPDDLIIKIVITWNVVS